MIYYCLFILYWFRLSFKIVELSILDQLFLNNNLLPQETAIDVEEIPYTTPRPIGNTYLAEHFDDREDFNRK